jgi:hypothetical protein
MREGETKNDTTHNSSTNLVISSVERSDKENKPNVLIIYLTFRNASFHEVYLLFCLILTHHLPEQ